MRIEGFRNPVNLEPLPGFVVRTMDDMQGSIEVSKDLSLSVTQPAIIREAEANLDLSNEGSS
jgi:hypothetical protein